MLLRPAPDCIAWRGEMTAGGRALSASLEVHIEQGPVLEQEAKTIGVVMGVQGVRRDEVSITGQREPRSPHADADVRRVRPFAWTGGLAAGDRRGPHTPTAVGTVGRIETLPSSIKYVIPAAAALDGPSVTPTTAILQDLEGELLPRCAQDRPRRLVRDPRLRR